MLNYWQFIAQEAAVRRSDGCTGVSEWHRECCLEHDLACHYGKDPRDAYRLYCGLIVPDYDWIWTNAKPISRRQADYAFANCNYEWSYNTKGKIRSFFRFLGVRLGALLGIGVRTPRDLS